MSGFIVWCCFGGGFWSGCYIDHVDAVVLDRSVLLFGFDAKSWMFICF